MPVFKAYLRIHQMSLPSLLPTSVWTVKCPKTRPTHGEDRDDSDPEGAAANKNTVRFLHGLGSRFSHAGSRRGGALLCPACGPIAPA